MSDFIKTHIERVKNTWYLLTGQLWFTPLMICFFVLGILSAITYFEYNYPLTEGLKDTVFETRVRNAKDIALALMSSMMTMTTLVISITIVVLSLASSQMGPRLIKAFISDDETQIYFGLFFGAVVATFYFVRLTHSYAFTESNLPVLTITFCVLYSFSTLFILLFFVNHVAKSCMADTIVTNVGNQLIRDIFRLVKNQPYLKNIDDKKIKNTDPIPKKYKYQVAEIKSQKEGYLQYLNFSALANKLADTNGFLNFHVMVGEHILKDETIATVYTLKKKDGNGDEVKNLIEHLNSYIDIGESRTRTQDLGYSLRHLVEIALRALSPGINDPYTATKVLDQLTAAMSLLFTEGYTRDFVVDDNDNPRIGGSAYSLNNLVHTAYDQIREAAYERLDINLYLLNKLQHLAEFSSHKQHHDILETQLHAIKECIPLQKTPSAKKLLKQKIAATEEVLSTYKTG